MHGQRKFANFALMVTSQKAVMRLLLESEFDMTANKALQPTATVLGSWQVAWSHNTVVAEARALPVAVAELGR